MISPETYTILAIPLAMIFCMQNEWKKAKELNKLFDAKNSLFDKFKKDLIKENYRSSSYYLFSTIVFFILLIIILCYASIIPGEMEFLSYIIGLIIFGCTVFLIISIFYVQTSFLFKLKDISLSKYVKDKKQLKDVNTLLKVYAKLKDENLKNNLEDVIVQFFSKLKNKSA